MNLSLISQAELMIATETELSGRDRSEILDLMTRNLEVMKDSVQTGLSPEKSPTGLTGGDAAKLDAYIKRGKTLADSAVLGAARNAMAVNESNAKMGLVCAPIRPQFLEQREDVKPKLGLPLLWLQRLLQWLLVEHLFKLAKPFASY